MRIDRWLATAALIAAGGALAAYPDRPVKVVVPFPAGSATDLVARVLSLELGESLKQPFVIENKPGAQGSIATDMVAKSAPDGYTLLLPANTHAANPSLYKKLPYEVTKDFVPIGRLATTSLVLMVKTDFPAQTLPEFMAHVKKNSGKLSAGYGSSSSQVSVSQLKKMSNIDVTEVPYKGIPLAVNDVLSGTLDFTFVDLGNALAQAKGGRLRGIAVTEKGRNPLAPDWPPMGSVLPGYEITAWFALFAPKGTPPDVVAKLQDATLKALAKPEVKEKLAIIGMVPAPLNSQETGKFVEAEVVKWGKLVKEAGIQPE
ncbi:MAG: tripartite tricarboxylate transporter substrate binding protein [Burkholderiales bacterium]|nr:tripartite tricarboxylate transporter substrate binding protein [Burkholderiales bacterium]